MSNSKIDETILSVLPAGGHSKKVAMVIAAVAKALASDLPEGDESYQLIARRIEGLVRAGQLWHWGTSRTGDIAKSGALSGELRFLVEAPDFSPG